MQSEADSRTGLDKGLEAESTSARQARRDRKFWIAMGMYAVLAMLVWFTLGEGTTNLLGRRIELRWIPLFVLGTFAFRTYLAREADKVRRQSQ